MIRRTHVQTSFIRSKSGDWLSFKWCVHFKLKTDFLSEPIRIVCSLPSCAETRQGDASLTFCGLKTKMLTLVSSEVGFQVPTPSNAFSFLSFSFLFWCLESEKKIKPLLLYYCKQLTTKVKFYDGQASLIPLKTCTGLRTLSTFPPPWSEVCLSVISPQLGSLFLPGGGKVGEGLLALPQAGSSRMCVRQWEKASAKNCD